MKDGGQVSEPRAMLRLRADDHALSHRPKALADDGTEVTRRWYKVEWRKDVGWLVDKIAEMLEEVVRNHVKVAMDRVAKIWRHRERDDENSALPDHSFETRHALSRRGG